MREALNSNPTVQIAVIGVLMVVAGFFVATQMMGGEKAAEAPAVDAGAGAVTGAAPVAADPSAAVPASGAAAVPVPAASVAPTAAAFKPGPGLPQEVVSAFNRGDTIALLIARSSGIDDRLVKRAAGTLRGDSNVAFFVTEAKGIARYSRITQGVGVSQVPALVVVKPRDGKGAPEATVTYGFRNSDSLTQAVRDAVYKGGSVGYDPG